MAGAIHNLLVWMLMATAASSWLVPAVIAAGDDDDVVDHGSTAAGTSSFEYISIADDYDTDDIDTDEDETDCNDIDEAEDEVNEYSDMGLQIWPDGKHVRSKSYACAKISIGCPPWR